ncbi:helix-turn-helix domain-containing protein [Amycolatopsis tolypomycina]|uniref:helix-turn-helix domain-containing protein n=1 Tax=Amycolatopsis tolypomycina TaxID=208445 RepID=UPI0033B11EE8
MSIEAIAWALNDAPIPRDRRDASSLAMVLVGLANHADPDGRNAFPSNATLIRYTRLSERSVRGILRTLEDLGLIHSSDPDIVAAYIRRPDRRPNGYDLNISLTSVDNSANPVDNSARTGDSEGQSLPPADQHEGQPAQLRGAHHDTTGGTHCPRTVQEPSLNRPPRTRATSSVGASAGAGERIAVPPPCGHCDARPGDTIAARTIPVPGSNAVRRCPRCHPTELTPAPELAMPPIPHQPTPPAGDR